MKMLSDSNQNITDLSRNKDIYRLALSLEKRGMLTTSVEFLVLSLIIAIAITGNSLVVLAFRRQPRLRIASNYYILSLAFLDLAMATLTMPLTLGVILEGRWVYGYTVCQIQGFLVPILGLSNVFLMLLISINRYVRLVKPHKYSIFFTPRRTLMSLVGAPVFSVAGTVYAVGNMFYFHPGKLFCSAELMKLVLSPRIVLKITLVVFFWFTIPFGVIGVCYLKVRKKILHHQAQVANLSNSVNMTEIKATKGLFAIILAFLLCYMQVPLIDCLSIFTALPREVYVFYTFMAAVSSAVNPFIYNATNRTFKAEFKKILGIKRINPQTNELEMR